MHSTRKEQIKDELGAVIESFDTTLEKHGLDVNRKNNIILFCNTENGSNYLAKDALGDNLYVIKKSDLDKDRTGIKTVAFWEGLYGSIA